MLTERTIRKRGPIPNYLFDKGIDKILKKVGEECAETIIAAKNDVPSDTVGEISDLIYHLMVMMVERNIPLEDVLDELLGNGASIVAHFAKAKTLFEDAKYHNCVFLGTDEQGVPRHAHKRSCNSVGKAFRQNIEGSDPRYSFHHIGTDGQLFVFEAPIDLLSYITMHPEDLQSHSYVACCGTSAIPVLSMLERISSPKEVYLCLDNDQAGETGSLRMAEKIAEQFNIASDRLLPEHKDWNDALCARNQEQIQAAMSMGMQV